MSPSIYYISIYYFYDYFYDGVRIPDKAKYFYILSLILVQ